jgi:hypothetical protein
VFNQIHLAWLLKEINAFLGRTDLANNFAEYGIKSVFEHAESMAKYNKGKIDQNYININKELFKMK